LQLLRSSHSYCICPWHSDLTPLKTLHSGSSQLIRIIIRSF
ncbi:hypothetical protein VN97_g13227, partial [Penicillium thymicola]